MMKIYEKLNDVTNTKWNKKPEDCTNHEIYYAMLEMTNKLCRDLPKPQGERKLYYFSAEFLVGKLLSNNLLALGIFEETEKVLESMGKKLSEIEHEIAKFTEKFTECFGTDEIVTTNKYVDQLISDFNDYYFDSSEKTPEQIKELIKPIEKYAYFKVPEFNSSYDTYIESSLAGFSSHSSCYDVGVIFDKDLGMFIVPFYGTLCHILETDNYQEVPGWAECIKGFMENDKIPASLVKRLAEKYPNFVDLLNDLYGTQMTLRGFLETYKLDYLKDKIYSPTSVLYSSKAFADLMGFIPTPEESKAKEIQKTMGATVGRNDPCPCGSGKKYKKCCGAMV